MNGWVESAPHRIKVSMYFENMPPVALFEVVPFVDEIYQGETIMLDGTPSYDPDDDDISYRWYSDIETYPIVALLGNRSAVNITLNTTGVQRIWLEVSDGLVKVRSEEVRIRVLPVKGASPGEEETTASDISDALPYILLALIIGLAIGAVTAFILMPRREERPVPVPPPVLVDAEMEVDYHPIKCRYCASEVRSTDTYCMKCGTVFNADDIEKMRAVVIDRPAKKRTRIELQQPSEESILPPSLEGEPMFLEGSDEAPTPEEEEGGDEEVEEMEEFEEDDDEEDWGVGP